MNVLVYGAGVIGCYLTHVLCEAGNDVTLLARGNWKQHLEVNGLKIYHRLQKKNTIDRPRLVEIPGDESYDAVFAVMQHQQMWKILDDLAETNAPLVVLVGNNMSAQEMEAYIHANTKAPKTVLFGFQGTGGRRENGQVVCVRMGGGSLTIGCLHTDVGDAVKKQITSLFSETKYRLTWMPDMDAWYKCHLAFILPVAYLCYTTGCDLRKASGAQRKRLLDAASEGYGLLSALGYPILPDGEDAYYRAGIKRTVMAAMMFVMTKTVLGDLAASDHCRHAVTEMEGLEDAWVELRAGKPDFPMPNWDALRRAMPDWETLHQRYDIRT